MIELTKNELNSYSRQILDDYDSKNPSTIFKDKITITSNFVDDLEFMGSLDYLGLGQASIKKVLSYIRVHNQGRISDNGKVIEGENIFNENFRIRDKVDHLRTSGFLSKVIPVMDPDNFNNGVTNELKTNFSSYKHRILSISNS